MNFKLMSNKELHRRTKELAREERRITVKVIRHLREVEDRRMFAEMGYSSLLDYCIHELSYSETSGLRRIAAVRISREVPEIEEKIEQGRLTLSNVALSQSFFKSEEKVTKKKVDVPLKREILESLENRSTRQAEKTLFELRPEFSLAVSKKEERRVSSKHTKIEMLLTDQELEDIRKLKSLLSHVDPGMSHKDLFLRLVRRSLEKLNPALKGMKKKREWRQGSDSKKIQHEAAPAPVMQVQELSGKESKPASEIRSEILTLTKPHSRKYKRHVPSVIKQEVWMRDGGVCSYTDSITGRKCGSRHRLQYDHEIPIAMGGVSAQGNIRLLCQTHNLLVASHAFGVQKMKEMRAKK